LDTKKIRILRKRGGNTSLGGADLGQKGFF